jgi:PAS domain S-box-containing protein
MGVKASRGQIDNVKRAAKSVSYMNGLDQDRFDRMIAEVEDYAILLLYTNGNILSWNKGAEKIKGYTSEEIIGKNYKIFYSKEDILKDLPEILLNEAEKKEKPIMKAGTFVKTALVFGVAPH